MDWRIKFPWAVTPTGRMKRGLTSIQKTEVFIYKASSIHRNKYCYNKSIYNTTKDKVIITCPVHGDFKQIPNSHLLGSGCKQCAEDKFSENYRSNTTEFISKAKKVHSNKYDYSKVSYGRNSFDKVTIICKIHGEWEQTPANHLTGFNCPKCNNSHIANILYIITDGTYYKIGITNNLYNRIRALSNAMNKTLTVVHVKKTNSARELEKKLHALPFNNPYSNECFQGYTEWRDIPKDKLEEIINGTL